ncbi:gcn5-related n-acetyltransferase [Ophiostoma piceae UAMH 11346]|uniref:Gcn5-related n-acetyltransferase n=1 Tax=Ophiostoma piceae (strain UAMH 11346) TaxID=1262450 RepID=S3C961_OPHP1|nr:gcn5-related n-acetyltransferase [Ophiostoma piceae UAMH 11346]
MSNQRSILSFFTTGSASYSSSAGPYGTSSSSAAAPPPPPPPPPPSSRFVPPPPRNGYSMPPGIASTAAATPRTPAPQPTLSAITREQSRDILLQAGATVDGDDLVFSSLSPSRCRIVYPRAEHIPGLVSVNAILLPVRYQDNFYHNVADPTRYASLFNRVILDEDNKVVGGIVGRLEESPFASSPTQLAVYVQSLALSSPYRGSGLMSAALKSIISTIETLNASESFGSIVTSLYCHVWTESDDALRWYEANGFRRNDPEPLANYYFKLQPNTAWVVRRDVARPSVLNAVAKAQPQTAGPPKGGPPKSSAGAPPKLSSSLSYQNSRPENEWNDLPADMVTVSGAPSATASGAVSTAPSATGSVASSRNVSRVNLADASEDGNVPPPPAGSSVKTSGTTRKKRERAYPAAMFQ